MISGFGLNFRKWVILMLFPLLSYANEKHIGGNKINYYKYIPAKIALKNTEDPNSSLPPINNDPYHIIITNIAQANTYNSAIPLQLAKQDSIEDKDFKLLPTITNRQQLATCISKIQALYIAQKSYNSIASNITIIEQLHTNYLKLNDRENEIWCRKELADFNFQQGNLVLAESELLKVLADYRAIKFPHILYTYDLLSALYFAKGDFTKALFYGLETTKNIKTAQDSSQILVFYDRVGGICINIGQIDQALTWYYKIIDYLISTKQTLYIYWPTKKIIDILVLKGKTQQALSFILEKKTEFPPKNLDQEVYLALCLGKVYGALDKYSLAEGYYKEAIRLAPIVNLGSPYQLQVDYGVANFYLKFHQYTKAGIFLRKILGEYQKGFSRAMLNNVYMGLFKTDSAKGNYLAAFKDIHKYQTLKDSAFSIAKNRQLEELQISYETDQKKKEINLLQNKEKLQQASLQYAINTRNYILAGAAMLILLLGISYNRFLLKKRSNKLLQLQREKTARVNNKLTEMISEKDNLLHQKEWLLKEVHHRVKNNLHTVISLLEIQAEFLENDALKAIETSQHRIYAMSLLHQKLYTSDDLKTVEMTDYLPELISYLKDGFGSEQYIEYSLDIGSIQLDVSQAMPLGLIINEAVSNSIKHAFSRKKNKVISIQMHNVNNEVVLKISDNGSGFVTKASLEKQGSLGLKLIKGLSEDLNAEISFENDRGTHITIKFSPVVLSYDNELAKITKESEANLES